MEILKGFIPQSIFRTEPPFYFGTFPHGLLVAGSSGTLASGGNTLCSVHHLDCAEISTMTINTYREKETSFSVICRETRVRQPTSQTNTTRTRVSDCDSPGDK